MIHASGMGRGHDIEQHPDRLGLRRRLALEVNRQIQMQNRREHGLRQLFWECTLRCNVHCRHCGSDCKVVAGVKDMPREDFFRVLDGIARRCNPHEVFVIVTGGEPLMREDIDLCGRGIYDRGFPWGMVTNGLLLTQAKLESLCRAGLHSITISLDGLEAEHNWMRGHEASFRCADRAISAVLTQPQLAFDVVTCVNQRNYGQLEQIRDYLVAKGLKAWRLFTVFPVGRAAADPDLQLSGEQLRGLLSFIRQTRREGHIRAAYGCEGFLGRFEGDVRDHFFDCQAGVSVGSVMSDGSIAACASIRSDFSQGNIYEDDFMEVWENRYLPYRDRSWMRTGECADCRYWRFCRGNGMHLRDADGRLILCHMQRMRGA